MQQSNHKHNRGSISAVGADDWLRLSGGSRAPFDAAVPAWRWPFCRLALTASQLLRQCIQFVYMVGPGCADPLTAMRACPDVIAAPHRTVPGRND
ncbi:hypothetical protein MTO96_000771 [Rhipicephalus appendiculatus]